MENILIQPTDFILKQSQRYLDGHILLDQYHSVTLNFAKFLKQPLALWQFVPVSESGEIYVDYKKFDRTKGTICEPYEGLYEVYKKGAGVKILNGKQDHPDDYRYYNHNEYLKGVEAYNKAKERCLFEGFTYKDGEIGFPSNYKPTNRFYELFIKDRIVEDMLGDMFQVTLSPTALKQIYG